MTTNSNSGNVAVKEEPICPPDQLVDALTVDRDPKKMNAWINVAFEDIIMEPTSLHSATCLWQNSIRSYTGARNVCYQCISGLCGLFVACWFGLKFASVAFMEIWCCIPCLKLTLILTGFYAMAFRKITYLLCYAFHFVPAHDESVGGYCCESCCCCTGVCCHNYSRQGGWGVYPTGTGATNKQS